MIATKRPGYRRDVDGLRAVAVLCVVIYHYGLALPGGFVGVDIFFVISGYVITLSLLKDIPKGKGWIGRFYAKRFRRILPALFVVIAASVLLGWFILMPGDYVALGKSAASSAFGLGNLFFYWNTGYFDREAELQPLLHLWSLGVEEQFYLIWPLAVGLLLSFGGAKRWAGIAPTAVLIAASLAFAQFQLAADPMAAFYLPFSRAWELVAGALLAYVPAIKSRTTSNFLVAAGLVLIGWSVLTISSDHPFPGIAALPAVIGSVFIVYPKVQARLTLFLSNRVMVGIGLVSYSFYLWHWPILVFFRHWNNGEMPTATIAVGLILLSCGLAYLTFRYVERRFIRHADLPDRKTVAAGFGAMAAFCLATYAIALLNGFPLRVPASENMQSLAQMWEWDCRREEISTLSGTHCTFGAPWEDADARTIIWGDSHAEHMAPLIEASIDENDGRSYALYRECPAAFGEVVFRNHPRIADYPDSCSRSREAILRYAQQDAKVTHFVLPSAWLSVAGTAESNNIKPGENGLYLLKVGLSDTINRLPRSLTIAIYGQVPTTIADPVPCQVGMWRAQCASVSTNMRREYDRRIVPINNALQELADGFDNVRFYSTESAFCDPTSCAVRLADEPLYRDGSHLRRNLRAEAKMQLAERLQFSNSTR